MAAVTIAAAKAQKTGLFHLNDLNAPLLGVLREAVEAPERLIADYEAVWSGQFACGDRHDLRFYDVRDRFNAGERTPANMLYPLARCVKGAVRYGRDGRFNQSHDKRRHGTRPETMAQNIRAVSALLVGKTAFTALDCREVLALARPGDVVYFDPPYQGVSDVRNPRYLSGLPCDEFAASLETLDACGIDYIVSYDGLCGEKAYGEDLPSTLRCTKILLDAGVSSQAVLLGKRSTTYEALYVNDSLLLRRGERRS